MGTIYPQRLPKGKWLDYYAREFDTVEINATYYRVPPPGMLEALARKVDPRTFRFAVKVPKEMTHERKKLHDTVPAFFEAIRPLEEARCLTTLLAQFPYSFKHSPEGYRHLELLREKTPPDLPLHVEFRNQWWYRPEVLEFLSANDLGFVNVDLPPLPGLPTGKTSIVTNGIAYFRFHGRNAARWWDHRTPGERYDYLYSDRELAEWLPTINKAARQARMTLLFMNNCHRGKSAMNAVQLQRQLGLRDPQDRAAWEVLERKLF